MIGSVRWAALVAVVASGLGACSILTNLDGLAGGPAPDAGVGDGEDAGSDGASNDAHTPDAADAADGGCDDDGLVAFWRFDEGSGIQIHDCTKNGNDGTLTVGAWVPGVHGSAISLDGGWVGFGTPPSLRITGDLTVAAFVRASVFPVSTNHGYIVGKTSNVTQAGWRLADATANGVIFGVAVDGGTFDVAPSSTLATATWVHLAGVIQSGTLSVYMDGNIVGAGDGGTPILASVAELRIGARADGLFPYIGDVDEVRLYSRALSNAEIRNIAQR
jgi:hypothetical protein